VDNRWKVVARYFCLAIAIVLTSRASANGVAFQASSLPVQVRGEGLTEIVGAVVLQATGSGSITAGSSISFVYSGAITNSSSFTGANTGGMSCQISATAGLSQGTCGSGTTFLSTSAVGAQFNVQFNSGVQFNAGDYIEVSQVRLNINALGSSATTATATLSGTSSAPFTNPITFTQSQVIVASIVNPSVQGTFPTTASTIGTCAVPAGQQVLNGAGNGFAVTVVEKYPAAITSTADEMAFSAFGTISNGSLVNIVISNVPAGMAVQANGYTATNNGSPITGGSGAFGSQAGSGGNYPNTYTVSLSGSTPAYQVSSGSSLTYAFSVTNDSTAAIEKFTVQFGIGVPNSGNNGLSSSVGAHAALGGTANVTATVSLAPSNGIVSFATNNDGSATVATVGDCAPVPTLSSISPTIVGGSSGAFALVANGSGFGSYSSIQWNGSSSGFTTVLINSGQIQATIPASFITFQGTASITVNNASPGGGTSQPLTLTIGNQTGSISGLSATNTTVGSPGGTLTVSGSNFVNGAVVMWQGSARTTNFVNSTTLTATLTAADFATAGTFAVTVLNPSPVPGPSNAINFTVNNPQPTITSLSTNFVLAGSSGFLLTVTGSNFVNGAQVLLFGVNSSLATTFVSSTSLVAAVPSSALVTPGIFEVGVVNPLPNLGGSSVLGFFVNNPQPTLSSLSAISAAAGSTPFLVSISGSNFVNGATVRVNGNNQTTIYGSSTSLGFLPTTQELASPGTWVVTVINPSPSQGFSNSLTFTVTGTNPAPTINILSPSTIAAGSAAFTLNVYGSNFAPNSIVQWGGTARSTTFLSSQQLAAIINAADIAAAGPVAVTVFSPMPGGGTSSPITFTVGSSSQGTLTAQAVNGSPGAPVSIPVVLNLNNGATVGALSFGVQLTPVNTAPAIAAGMAFQSDAALPVASGSPTISATNSNVGVFYGSFTASLTGQVTIGVVQVAIPATAAVGQTYTVHVTEADAAQGGTAVPLSAGADATVTLVLGYLVGDSFPHTADTVGSFGDGALNTLDLIDVLRAVTNISTPATCSDRFDDIDASPADTTTQRGGDGVLNTLDLIETLRRATVLDPSRPQRTPRGLTCSQNEAESRRPPEAAGITEGTIEVEGNAIYLAARRDLNLKGLAVSFRLPEGQQANFTPGEIPASIVDAGQPGKIAMAYLNGITLASGQRLLLGSVDGVDRGALLGVSANDRNGQEIRITAGAVRVR